MRQELARHRVAYSVLLLLLFLFGVGIFGAWPNREMQRYLIVGLAASYFVWGIVTHVKSDSITSRVVIEYGIVSLLAGAFLTLMTF